MLIKRGINKKNQNPKTERRSGCYSTSSRVSAAAMQPSTSGEFAEYPVGVSSMMTKYSFIVPHGGHRV